MTKTISFTSQSTTTKKFKDNASTSACSKEYDNSFKNSQSVSKGSTLKELTFGREQKKSRNTETDKLTKTRSMNSQVSNDKTISNYPTLKSTLKPEQLSRIAKKKSSEVIRKDYFTQVNKVNSKTQTKFARKLSNKCTNSSNQSSLLQIHDISVSS